MGKDAALIMEISVHNNILRMGIFPREEHSAPVKNYSELTVSFGEIRRLVDNINAVLNKAEGGRPLEESSILELKKSGQLLYDYLLTRSVKNKLSESAFTNLILSFDEKLVHIPWELLYDGNEFLCLKFNLGRLISTGNSDIQPRYRAVANPLKMLVLSNPTADLKSAYEEGLSIKNYLSKRADAISVDFKARNIDKIYIKKNLRDYDIVHYAGHCRFDEYDPVSSGWVLEDGILSTKEFAVMGEALPLPAVVFANACQSASSALIDFRSGRSVYGLAQAFLFAGVRHYIGALWELEDDPGFSAAEHFYKCILSGNSLGEALRLARLSLIKKYGLSNVAWANYVFYGDPGFSLFKRAAASAPSHGLAGRLMKKRILIPVLSAMLLTAAIFWGRSLPSLVPGSYFMFSRAGQYFLKGGNQEALNLSNSIIKKDSSFLPAYKMLGDIYFRLGDYASALRSYMDYASRSEKTGDTRSLASAYVKIAWVYHMWGEYPKAKGFYDKALILSRREKDYLNEADALERLSVWYTDKEKYEEAFSLLTKSCEINQSRKRDPEHRFNLACDYFSIGYLYTQKGDYPAAKDFFNKSKVIFDSLGAVPELDDYYFDMGEIALYEKNYNKALELYKQGLELDKKLGSRFGLSSDYQMLGELYLEMKKFAEAESYFQQAIDLCEEINNDLILAGVYYDLAILYKETDKLARSREYFRRSLEIYQKIDTPDYQKVRREFLALD
ncbi:MAG: tetratricopeptide repeat protein [Candidatus Omnitrophica bacterium]|nr:tetratricopeptide repeat protein [Candidatus Omnitrophota bacterium]